MSDLLQIYHNLLQPAITIGWPISYMELIILVFNVSGVYLAARNNVLTAPVCLVGITAYTAVCYSLNFYSEFFLQIYFFCTNIWLLFAWSKRNADGEKTKPHYMGWLEYLAVVGLWTLGTWFVGTHIDAIFSGFTVSILAVVGVFTEVQPYVHQPAAFPYVDAFTTVGQVLAMVLMVRRVVENWWMWIVINLVSIPMFVLKGGYGVAIMFVFFLIPAIAGAKRWMKLAKEQ